MDDFKKLERMFEDKPRVCEKCGGRYEYNGAGEYKCNQCGNLTYDDYGKVRKFIEENGPAPYHVVKKATGVNGALVRQFLDAPSTGDRFDKKCAKCGCAIAVGTLCSNCSAKAGGGGTMPKPEPEFKSEPKPKNNGGMHFVVDRKRGL